MGIGSCSKTGVGNQLRAMTLIMKTDLTRTLCQRKIQVQSSPEQTATLVKSSPEQTKTLAKMNVDREQSIPDQTVTQNKDLRPVTGSEGK